jgi:putative ATP-dependent endonuclease of OLD family
MRVTEVNILHAPAICIWRIASGGIFDMRIVHLHIQNFRSIEDAEFLLPENVVLVGDNNSGKSTILEAIDLVLGPERMKHRPVIDEHDFYEGRYIAKEAEEGEELHPVEIRVEATVIGLNEEQESRFQENIEFWDLEEECILEGPPAERTDEETVVPALRVVFVGSYSEEEDDFEGGTYFMSPETENGELEPFRTHDKRFCGFLLLRTLRTGSRALSLEHGSLLDIILRLREKRVQIWEDVISELREVGVAEDEELGLSSTLVEVQAKLRSFIPTEWADDPHIRVSDLTRESLRRVLTVFMASGAEDDAYAVPFRKQGTGTINMLVFALLSMIADEKQNVIFAMEEPEIAIPPYTQKRVIESVKASSSQVLLTSHSPYVIEEFPPDHVVVLQRDEGSLTLMPSTLPPTVKMKAYRREMRTRFCEALLARRVLVVEGRTEYDALPSAARRLASLYPEEHRSLDSLGIAVVDAETDSQVVPLVEFFERLGKTVFAVFDKQDDSTMSDSIEHGFESPEKGFERLLAIHTDLSAIESFIDDLIENDEWPLREEDKPEEDIEEKDLRKLLVKVLRKFKGSGEAAALIRKCDADEMPEFIVETLTEIQGLVEPAQGVEDEEDDEEDGEDE